jgi:putative hydrolase of the HAD superfamily
MIRAVLFDLDETLLDRTGSLVSFLADQHARYGECLGHAPLPAWRARFLALDEGGHVHKSIVYPAILKEFGGDPGMADTLLADYRETCCRHARPFDGAAALLGALRAQGLKLGLVTNGETDFQMRHVRALGLDGLMDTVLVSQAEGLRKPDPDIFRRAADRLGVAVPDCLFVGDNPQADILGAHRAGMKTVWFCGAQTWPVGLEPNPGAAITRLADLILS